MTSIEFAESMTELCGFYSKQLNDFEKKFWFKAFKDFSPDQFKRRIERFILTSKNNWFPSIGELRKCPLCADSGEIVSSKGYKCLCTECKGKKEIEL
jgi:hypothetical protein